MALVKFKDLDNKVLKELVVNDEHLRQKFDNFIQECELDYLGDKIACVSDSLYNWSYGFFSTNYMIVRDYCEFVDGVKKCILHFGGSQHLTKLVEHCDKLRGTNLFEYFAKKMQAVFEQEELQDLCNYVEDVSYELYNKEIGEKCEDYFEAFSYNIEEYLYNEEDKTYYKPMRVA